VIMHRFSPSQTVMQFPSPPTPHAIAVYASLPLSPVATATLATMQTLLLNLSTCPAARPTSTTLLGLRSLLAHGLIRASFVPGTRTQELRTLLRTRKQLVREKSSHILRVQKTLEDANIKLDSVNSSWAEPSLDHAAMLMPRIYENLDYALASSA
jgi:hypothetical protein